MKIFYENNPIELFFEAITSKATIFIKNGGTKLNEKIDPLLKNILMNNGCGFIADGQEPTMLQYDLIEDQYVLCFICGGKANSVNEYFDYVYFNGTQYLVVFLDYFMDIMSARSTDEIDIIESTAKDFMGASIYFDAISKITSIFLTTLLNPAVFTSALSTTSAGLLARNLPLIVAANFVYNCLGTLEEEDIYGHMSLQVLTDYLDPKTSKLACYGMFK